MNSSVYLDHFHFSKYSTHLNGASIETSDSQILIVSNMTYVTLKAMKIRSQGIYWMSICCVILLTEYVYQCQWKKMWPESELNPRLMQRVRQFQRTRRHFRHWWGELYGDLLAHGQTGRLTDTTENTTFATSQVTLRKFRP